MVWFLSRISSGIAAPLVDNVDKNEPASHPATQGVSDPRLHRRSDRRERGSRWLWRLFRHFFRIDIYRGWAPACLPACLPVRPSFLSPAQTSCPTAIVFVLPPSWVPAFLGARPELVVSLCGGGRCAELLHAVGLNSSFIAISRSKSPFPRSVPQCLTSPWPWHSTLREMDFRPSLPLSVTHPPTTWTTRQLPIRHFRNRRARPWVSGRPSVLPPSL